MAKLIIETIADINYYRDGSKLINGKLEGELISMVPQPDGDGFSATYEYFGYDGAERFKIQSGDFSKTKEEMDVLYDLIRPWLDPADSKSDLIVYENSVTFIQGAVDKFVGINSGLSSSNFKIQA